MSEDQGHLIEVPQFRFGTTLLISLWSSLVTTVLMVLVVSTCFVAINVFFFLAEGQLFQQFAGKLVKGVPLFAGFSFAFIGVITLPVSLVWGVTKRAKYIAVEGNSFVVETAWSKRRFPLSECLWMTPHLGCDSAGFYPPNWKVIVVGWTDRTSVFHFACGFTENAYESWKSFLTLNAVPFKAQIPINTWLLSVIGGGGIGSVLGVVIGGIAAGITGKPNSITAFGFVGFLDGCVWGISRTMISQSSVELIKRAIAQQWQRWVFNGVVAPLTGFLLGAKIGLLNGVSGAIMTGLVNSVATSLIAWNRASAIRIRLESNEAFPSHEDDRH